MKELSRKTFLTIFCILSSFLMISVILVNVQSYKRERESVDRSLNFIDDRGGGFKPGEKPEEPPEGFDGTKPEDAPGGFGGPESGVTTDLENTDDSELENMMFMDNEVYTVEIIDGIVSKVINHGNESSDFDAGSVAEEIMAEYEAGTRKIGNLYTADYSFNYKTDGFLVVVNDSEIKSKLVKFLLETLLIFVVLEGVVVLIAKLMTRWITKPAQEAFDKQKDFIADASHELKTPLAVIMASSDELSGDENKKYIENIKYESDRMNRLISGMLDLSKLEQSASDESFKETFTEVKLSKLVEKTCLVFEGVAFEQGVEIETEVEKEIVLSCNKDEMEKLVSTLLDNAVKHSDKGTAVTVKLYKEKHSKDKNSVVLKVVNSGDPIAPGDEEKIFERFYRADKSRNRGENRYGLGLAIAKSIVLSHGGTIKAYSKEGKTTFKVTLIQNK